MIKIHIRYVHERGEEQEAQDVANDILSLFDDTYAVYCIPVEDNDEN